MPEPISIAASAISTALNAFTISKATYDLIKSAREAPSHISRLSADVHGLYVVLGRLQSLLEDDSTVKHGEKSWGMYFADLEDLLKNCVNALIEIQKIANAFLRDRDKLSIWRGLRWEVFKKNDVLVLQNSLSSYKLTLNIACNSLVM